MKKRENFLGLDPARGAILEVDEGDSSIRLYIPVFSCDGTDDNSHAKREPIDMVCVNLDPKNTGLFDSVVNAYPHSDKQDVSRNDSPLGVKSQGGV
jgi:hypothetical protein